MQLMTMTICDFIDFRAILAWSFFSLTFILRQNADAWAFFCSQATRTNSIFSDGECHLFNGTSVRDKA
jgi:hypothetical protein